MPTRSNRDSGSSSARIRYDSIVGTKMIVTPTALGLTYCTVVILVMQQPNKTNPIDATPTDKPYFTPHTISTHQNVKIGNQCIS